MRAFRPLILWAAFNAALPGHAAPSVPPAWETAARTLARQAAEGHPALAEAEHRAAEAREKILQAGALPETVFALEAGENGEWAPWEAGELTLGATQPLGRPAVRAGERELARLEAERAALAPDRLRKRLALEVKSAVLETVHLAALVRHWEAMTALAEQVESTVALKVRGGEAPYAEVLRARLETLKARNRLQQAVRDRDRSRNALAHLAGLEPGALPTLPEQLDAGEPPPSVEVCLEEALGSSLILREAAIEEGAAAARGRMAGRNGAPEWTVGLFVQHLKDQPPFDANDFEGTEGNAWGASVEVAIPLFGRERLSAARTGSEAAQRAAAASRSSLERTIRQAVARAHDGLGASLAAIAAYEDALLPDLEEAMRGARDQYAFQQSVAADLFGVYATYREARGEYLEALRGAAEARVALEAAAEPGLAAGHTD